MMQIQNISCAQEKVVNIFLSLNFPILTQDGSSLSPPPEGNSTSCDDLEFYCDMFTMRTSICLSKYKKNSCALNNVINIFILKLPKFDRTQPFTTPLNAIVLLVMVINLIVVS